MSEEPKAYSLETKVHTAAVDVVVRFLKAQNPETAREAIKQYLKQ